MTTGLTTQDKRELMATLSRLGGKGLREDDIVYEGVKFVLPENFRNNPKGALAQIQKKFAEADEKAIFSRTYNYRPWDGAYCAYKALKSVFGMVRGEKIPGGFFSPERPPAYIQVPISVSETEEVPWGRFSVPAFDATDFYFQQAQSDDYGIVFQITVEAPRKYREPIEGLFAVIEEELKRSSIYRGKAIDGQSMPTFLALDGVDPTKVIYSEDVQADLAAHIWSVFRYQEANAALHLPNKRAVLLVGQYGTGKSLAGYLTAQEAVRGGWTFIMVRPGRDDLMQSMQTARLYQPAVVFFEDADTVTGTNEGADGISEILDVFDGIQSKGSSLMVVMTTNHPERIHKGMHRPGRVDAQIEIGALDARGIQMLIEATIPPSALDTSVDWDFVTSAFDGYVPAFVKEAADRAQRYALVRNNGVVEHMLINGNDLVHAATSLRPQYERMVDAPELEASEKPLSQLVLDAAAAAVRAHVDSDYLTDVDSATEQLRRNGTRVRA